MFRTLYRTWHHSNRTCMDWIIILHRYLEAILDLCKLIMRPRLQFLGIHCMRFSIPELTFSRIKSFCLQKKKSGSMCQVDRAMDSRSEGLGFDSQCCPWAEVSLKRCIPHCLGPSSCNRNLVHRSKVGSIVAGCCAPTARRGKVRRTCVVTWISRLYTDILYL